MGKKAKIGKRRRDKFYALAKESGYRSRAAFKLIQLNQTYSFLNDAKVCIDLCAAPGGWLQVAAKYMPVAKLLVGVDLFPIKPIKNVTTLCCDITTEKCKHEIMRHLGHHAADVVLHDGAPSMGTSWISDAYAQNVLTLKALQIAVEFLRPNGWFVTKLFRAKDYFSLVWVAQQFFRNIHTTKPSASRIESSEIFVVCQGFIPMRSYDPRFFDEKFVFQEVLPDKQLKISVNSLFSKKKNPTKVRNRDGYPDDINQLYKNISANEFMTSENYVSLLGEASEITIDDEFIKNHPATTAEILECIKDIKVLGKREVKGLLVWRKKIRADMHNPAEKLKIEDPANVEKIRDTEMEENVKDDDDDTEGSVIDDKEKEIENLLVDAKESEKRELKRRRRKLQKMKQKHRQRLALKMVNPDDEFDLQNTPAFTIEKANELKQLVKKGEFEAFTQIVKSDQIKRKFDSDDWFKKAAIDLGAANLVDGIDELLIDEEIASDDEAESEDMEVEEVTKKATKKKEKKKTRKEPPLTPEEVALAHVMKQDNKSREKIIDDAYCRFTGYGDTEGLPSWFVEDEEKNCRNPPSAPEELVEEYRDKMKGINARPIKKVLQAKQRKRVKQLRAVQRIMKKVDSLPETLEPAERMRQIEEIYRVVNAEKKKKKSVTLIVAGKGSGGRPSVPKKGRYKVVDRRMKKDKRAEKKKLHKKRK